MYLSNLLHKAQSHETTPSIVISNVSHFSAVSISDTRFTLHFSIVQKLSTSLWSTLSSSNHFSSQIKIPAVFYESLNHCHYVSLHPHHFQNLSIIFLVVHENLNVYLIKVFSAAINLSQYNSQNGKISHPYNEINHSSH